MSIRVVYCLLGSCDIREDYPEVVSTAEDYLWFKLGQVTELPGQEGESSSTIAAASHADLLTYNHLQSLIVQEYGTLQSKI